MTWEAVDERDPDTTHVVEVHPDCVQVLSRGDARTYALVAGEIGVGKWTTSPAGTVLVLGTKQRFRVGARDAHYRYETRAPEARVEATLDADAFHDLMRALQAAWRARHTPGGGYRGAPARSSVTRQYFALHRVSRWVPVCTALALLAIVTIALGPRTAVQLFGAVVMGVWLCVLLVARIAAEIELRRPSWSLEIEDGRARIRRGKRTRLDVPLAEARFDFAAQPYEVGLTVPGRRYRLLSTRYRHLPLGVFQPLNVLFIDPDALPFLWSVVAPQPELASAPIRGSVPVASDTAAIPRRDG